MASNATCSALFSTGVEPNASGICAKGVSFKLFLSLLTVSLRAVATAGACASVGALLAVRGVLSKEGKTLLSYLSMNVTIPCLLFSSSAAAIRPALLKAAWPMMFLPFVYVSTALLFGTAMLRVINPPAPLRKVLLAATAFGNSTGLPIVLLTVVGDLLITPAVRAKFGAGVDPLAYLSVRRGAIGVLVLN